MTASDGEENTGENGNFSFEFEAQIDAQEPSKTSTYDDGTSPMASGVFDECVAAGGRHGDARGLFGNQRRRRPFPTDPQSLSGTTHNGFGSTGGVLGDQLSNKRYKSGMAHQVVCRHWLRGMCIKGDDCDFLHIFDHTRMPLCRNFRRNGFCAEHAIGVCPLRHRTDDGIGDRNSDVYDDNNGPTAESESHSKELFNENNRGDEYNSTNRGKNHHYPSNNGTLDSSSVGGHDHRRNICMRYLFGFCGAGPGCQQKHVTLKRRDLIDAPLPDWYLHLILANREDGETSQGADGEARQPAQLDKFFLLSASDRQLSTLKWHELADRLAGKPLDQRIGMQTLEDLMPEHSLCAAGRSKSSIRPYDVPLRIKVFVIKSGKIENILTSVQKGIWATGRANIDKFEEAFKTCDHVLFLMSANESGGFQGYARMASLPNSALYPRIWGYFSVKLSPNFRVHWLKQCKLDFEALASYTNPLNCNKPLKKSRDGQEMPLDVAEAICLRLEAAPKEDLLAGTPQESLPRIDHDTFFTLTPQQQLEEEVRLGFRTATGASVGTGASSGGHHHHGGGVNQSLARYSDGSNRGAAPPPPPPPPPPEPAPAAGTVANGEAELTVPNPNHPISHPVQHITVMTGYKPVVNSSGMMMR